MNKYKCAPLEKIPQALEKTGFLLEHLVSEEFQKSGWSVIGNRYYIDDVDGKARELDLVAYRIAKSEDIDVCTGVLVSCKKDSENTWAFMSKDRPAYDPNVDWEPVHYWTDREPLASFLESCDWRKKYIKSNHKIYESLFQNTRDVFATQLISSDGTAPKNDKPFFDSITGLLKALDHEMGALPNRVKGKNRIYLFTLVAVVEAPLVDVQYKGQNGEAVEIECLTHLARYMVRKRDLVAHVHFVRSDAIAGFVENLNRLAAHNAAYMESLIGTSFDAIRVSEKVRNFFAKKLTSRLRWRLSRALLSHDDPVEVNSIALSYNEKTLSLDIDANESAADFLNKNIEAQVFTKKALKEVARYEGLFKFDTDIPF